MSLHVFNTRPAGQAAALTQALQALGLTVTELPLIAITPRALDGAEQRLLLDLDRYDAVFFVSANAARLGLEAVADYWPQWPHALPAYAVGESTAAVLRETALTVELPAQADTEGLLALSSLQQVAGKKFLLLRGVGGRELLRETLQARGATVDVVELYHRELPVDAAQRLQSAAQADVVILTSPDALRHWLQLAGAAALRPCWLVVSARMQAQAEAAGATVLPAQAADVASIVVALQQRYS